MTPIDKLHAAIQQAMDTETRRIVDEEAKAAANRVEQRVRGMAGQIATRVATHVSFQHMGHETRIIVRLPDRDKEST